MLHEDPRWHGKAALERPELLGLLKQWQGWAQQEAIPLRRRFDPVEFPKLLPWIILAEILNDRPMFDARFRYLGTEIVHNFNSENLTGTRLSDLEPIFVHRWSEVGQTVVAARAPQFFHGAPFMVNKAFLTLEMLALPLSKSGETVDFVVLAMAREAKERPKPRGK
ncbi:MAG TPA: PAS domain-containing protein [Dongiaceae bacterium]